MPPLLIIGGGLFGSQAAAHARSRGLKALVFDAGLPGAASAAAAGLFKEEWAGKKWRTYYEQALPILDQIYGIRHVQLMGDEGARDTLLWVPPRLILEPNPIRHTVTAVGDGWLDTAEEHYEGWVYVAAGVWSDRFLPGLRVVGKAGSAFIFDGEREGRWQSVARGRQAIVFVREPGTTYFSDGTAEASYTAEHERLSLERAAGLGLSASPIQRYHGYRPYTPGGPLFKRIGNRTWLATGGRKMGTIFGAAFARRLVEEILH
jgi:glycine/D-amino acid oxidase-like deaminating enzyme